MIAYGVRWPSVQEASALLALKIRAAQRANDLRLVRLAGVSVVRRAA